MVPAISSLSPRFPLNAEWIGAAFTPERASGTAGARDAASREALLGSVRAAIQGELQAA